MKLKYYIRKSLKRTKNAVKKNRAMKINKTYRKQKKKKARYKSKNNNKYK